jgi:glycosyltransferase involved in cell wall biosynthesis
MDLWLRSYFNAADLVLAPSRSVQQYLAARLRPKVAVLGRGVDSVHFHPAKRKRGADRPRALYVGRVAPEKNLDLLAWVFDGRDDCELMVVGDGPYVGVLRQRLPQAFFAGTLEGEPLAARTRRRLLRVPVAHRHSATRSSKRWRRACPSSSPTAWGPRSWSARGAWLRHRH